MLGLIFYAPFSDSVPGMPATVLYLVVLTHSVYRVVKFIKKNMRLGALVSFLSYPPLAAKANI